jgi:hypothetical protein
MSHSAALARTRYLFSPLGPALLLGALVAATGCGSLSISEVYVDSGGTDQGAGAAPGELPAAPVWPVELGPSATLPGPVFIEPPEMPATAYDRAGGPPPVQARMVSPEEYLALLERGKVVPTSRAERQWQALVAALGVEEDRARVTAFEAEHRARGRLVPLAPEPDDQLRLAGDGNYLNRLLLASGEAVDVMTYGRPWLLATAADALDQYRTRANQLALYAAMHAALPDFWVQVKLSLPPPEGLASSETLYPAAYIAEINRRASDFAHEQLKRFDEGTGDIGPWSQVEPGQGLKAGTDQLRNRADPRCEARPDGLLAGAGWPMKAFVSPVKDQGLRGTASAFALASAFETALAHEHGMRVNLSEQSLYSRMRLTWDRADFGDGVLAAAAASSLREERFAVPLEDHWRYNPSARRKIGDGEDRYSASCHGYLGVCSEWAHQAPMVCADSGGFRYCGFGTLASLPEEDEASHVLPGAPAELWDLTDPTVSLARTLLVARVRPVVASLVLTEAWNDATVRGGLISAGPEAAVRGGHVVHLVGHVLDAALEEAGLDLPPSASGGYLIVKNSWTNCWGDAGFGYLSFEDARRSILSAVAIGNSR